MPPKPAEAAKVQPKKETVRINLPPKPTSAPTIKLPTLAQAGPATSPGTAAPPAAPRPAAPPPPSAPPPPRPGTTAAPRPQAAPAPVQQRPAPYVAPAAGIGMLDKILAIVAVVAVLAAVGSCLYLVLGGIPGLTPN